MAELTAEQVAERVAAGTTKPETDAAASPSEPAPGGTTPTEAEAAPEGEPQGKPEEEPTEVEPQADEKATKELQRLHGVLKTKQAENQKLRDGMKALQEKATVAPSRETEETGEADTGDDPRWAKMESRMETMAQDVQEARKTNAERAAMESEAEENAVKGKLEVTSLGIITKFCSDLIPKDVSSDERSDAEEVVEALSRQEFLKLARAEGIEDDGDLLAPENVETVAKVVRERYKKIGASMAARQMQDNSTARQETKTKPDGTTAVPKPLDLTKMNEGERLAAMEKLAADRAAAR